MNSGKEFLKVYGTQLKKNRFRLAAGGFAAILLIIVSAGTVNGRNLILCALLGIGCGCCIGLPKPVLSMKTDIILNLLMLGIYAFLVPRRIFWRTEFALDNHMSGLFPGAAFFNICIILILFFMILFLAQRTSLALGLTGIVCLFFTVVNHYVTAFRGASISLSDIRAVRTAVTVAGAYKYSISAELWKSIVYDLFFILLGFRIDVRLKGVKYHAVITTAAVMGLVVCFCLYHFSSYWEVDGINGENGNIRGGEKPYGAYLYLIVTGKASGMQKPLDYSDSEVTKIAEKTKEQYQGSDQETSLKPHIIFIMNETWSDLQVLGNLEVTADYLEFYHSLDKNTKKGYVYVDVLGGMTCNSEFEALTGDAMSLLDIAAIPYEMQVDHLMESLATVLKKQGYYALAMHPNVAVSWNRGPVI